MHESLHFWNPNLSQHVFRYSLLLLKKARRTDAELVYQGSSHWNTVICATFLFQKIGMQPTIVFHCEIIFTVIL